jgi:hypothetical protein
LLPVPAEKFLDQVTEAPSDRELHARYEMFRSKEPAPASRDPGFKEPRRILVEYVMASPDDPFYRDEARKQARLLGGPLPPPNRPWSDPRFRAGWCVGAGYMSPLGAGPLGPALAQLAPMTFDPIRAEYDRYLEEQHSWLTPPTEELFDLERRHRKLHLSSIARPANVASTLGVQIGASGGAGGPFAALSTLYATSTTHELRGSIRQSLTVLLSRADPEQVFGTAALAMLLQPKVFTQGQLQSLLVATLEERLGTDLVRRNLETVTTELAKLRTRPKAAEEYLAKAVKEYHLKRGGMKEPLPLEALVDRLEHHRDVGLGALLEAVQKRDPGLRVRDFVEQGLFEAMARAGVRSGVYEARPLEGVRQEFLFWRKEDHPARERPFEVVRADVIRAWKMERARVKAEQKARKVAEAINDKPSLPTAERILQGEEKSGWGPIFRLNNVAQLVVPEREVHLLVRGEYLPYRVPEDMRSHLPHPPADLVKQLLMLERPGEATVIADQPARTFYVAVLVSRDEPTVKQFREVYQRTPRFDTLYTIFTLQRMDEYRRSVLEQLRREAARGKVDKDGRYEVPEDIRKRESGRSGEAEE